MFACERTCCAVVCRYAATPFILSIPQASMCHLLPARHITRFVGLGCFRHDSLAEVRGSIFMVEEYVGLRCLRRVIRYTLWDSSMPKMPLFLVCVILLLGSLAV